MLKEDLASALRHELSNLGGLQINDAVKRIMGLPETVRLLSAEERAMKALKSMFELRDAAEEMAVSVRGLGA